MDLATLRWVSDTTQLKETIGVIQQVRAAVSTLETAQTKAATNSAKADKAAADAAKAQAQAALAAIKLEKEKQKAVQESSDATVAAGNRSISVLEKQEQVLNFMVQGYSRGQSSILATAKAAGAATDELERLGSTLQSQRTLMGSDPFDKSLGALRALKNEFSVVKEQVRLYNAELGLTRKQSEDLARDKLRLIEASKIEGKSIFSIRDAVKDLNTEYIRLAKAENDLVGSYKNNVKTASDAAKANTYLETELQKVRFAVDEQNAALNRGSANALVRFENALKKSGKTTAEQKILLDEYRKSMEKLQSAGAGRATDYISRAVGPQLTDIIVGLSTGQSLMTVMMQQGGQLRDQFAMMGVAGAEMGAVMRTALSSMAVSVKDTAVAFGQLFVGGVMDAAKAINTFAGNVTGITQVFDGMRYKLYWAGQEGNKTAEVLYKGFSKFGGLLTAVTTGALALGVSGVVALGVAAYQTMKENNELAKSLALSGGSLAVSHQTALMYVDSLNVMGVTTSKATEALSAMAKEGTFTSGEIMMVAKSAADMSKWAGISIEDTVKAFAKLKEKPVEALTELALKTGMVSLETLRMVQQLQEQGKTAEASGEALKAYASVTAEQTAKMKENYNDLTVTVINLGDKISQFFSKAFKSLFMAPDVAALEEQLSKVNEAIDQNRNMPTFGSVFGGKNALKELEEQREAIKDQISQIHLRSAAEEESLRVNRENAKNFETINSALKDANKTIDNATAKTMTLSEYTKKYTEDRLKGVSATSEQMKVLEKAAEIEWKAMQKKPSTAGENYFANLLRSVTNESINAEAAQDKLTKAYTKMLELASDSRFLKLSETQKAMVMEKLNEAHNTELLTQRTKDLADAEELRNKILGKVDGQGKEYYSTIEKLNSAVKSGAMGQEEATELAKSLGQATPFAKAMSEWFARGREALSKYTDEFKKFSAESQMQNQELDLQFALLGKSSDEQKKMTIEAQKQIKLQKALNDYERERLKILNDQNLVTDDAKNQAMLLNDQKYAEQVRLINRETAYQYAADVQQQFNEIRDGISGSIVDALFNGGKSGAQKLRSLLIEQLKKPVTLVVNAMVNTVLGNVIGSLVGGSGGSAGGVGLLGTLSSAGGIIGNVATGLQGTTGMLGSIGTFLGTNTVATNAGIAASLGIDAASANAAALGANAAGGGFLSSIGSAMPYIGAAAALFSIISGLDDSGTYHTGGAAQYSVAKGLTSGSSGAAYNFGFGQVEAGKETISAMATLSKSLTTIFDGIAKSFGQTVGYEVSTAFADDTSEDGAWGALKIALNGQDVLNWNDFRQSKWAPKEFGDGEEGYKQYLAAVAKDSQKILMDSLSGVTWAKDILAAIGDSPSIEQLSSAVQEIATLQSTFEVLKRSVQGFGDLSDDVLSKLVRSFGGAGNLANSINQFYTDFYTEAEKTANVMNYLTSEFTKQNLVLPKTREDYRKLVESQDLNTESGRALYTTLMELAPAFASIVASTEGITQELQNNAIALQIDRLRILGQEEEALAMEREIAIKGLNDYQVAMWDANKTAQYYNESLSSVNSLIPTVLKKFLSEDEWTKYQTNEVANNLVKSNVAFKDITSAVSWLTSATKEQIEIATRELFDMQGLTIDQKKVLLESANIMADLKDTSSKVADDIKKAFTKAGDDIVAYIRELTVGRGGLATPMELLDKTRQVYTQDLAAASAGDGDAAGRLVQSAKAYIDAQKTVTASSSFTNDVIKTIISQLSGLGFVNPILQSGSTFIPQYANGGVFTNSVVSQPTTFGLGVMGEAGPEAIMPLSRSSDGRLGVSTDNSSTNKLIERLIVEVQTLREQQSQETAGIISTNISVTEGTAQAVVDKLNEKDRQASSQPTLN